MHNQLGNALFIILIAVLLFTALSYAVTQSSRGGGNANEELASIAQAEYENCTIATNTAKLRIEMINGCDEIEISYEYPDGTNINSNAPSDKSCHIFSPSGGGASPCGPWINGCEDSDLALLANVGDSCGFITYAGVTGGNRIYTTRSDQGAMNYATSYATSGATSMTDGQGNTDTLVITVNGSPYSAALSCRSLGAEWYLPARDELLHLYSVRDEGDLSGTFDAEPYWSSTESSSTHPWQVYFSDGSTNDYTAKTYTNRLVRCIRQ